jgi:hypothetical protein
MPTATIGWRPPPDGSTARPYMIGGQPDHALRRLADELRRIRGSATGGD